MPHEFNLIQFIDDWILTAGDGPFVAFEWPFDNQGGMHAEKVLAQFGVRVYRRRWPMGPTSTKWGGTYGFSVRKSQFLWAYDILLSHGVCVVKPPPPTPRLQRMAADRNHAMSKQPQSAWGAPVRNRGLTGWLTNMWRGDIRKGMKPTKKQLKERVQKQGRKIIKELFR